MKILIVTATWEPQVNDVVRSFRCTAKALAGQGYSDARVAAGMRNLAFYNQSHRLIFAIICCAATKYLTSAHTSPILCILLQCNIKLCNH